MKMLGLNYARLERIMKTEKPFRGTTDRFPLGSRKHNLKNFFVREVDGKKVFDVTCGTHWNAVNITEAEYEEAVAKKQEYKVHKYENDGEVVFKKYEHPPYILGTVHPEEYFQFTANAHNHMTYGQGERAFLSANGSGFYSRDVRRGGMIWKWGREIVPIFHNMRVSTKINLVESIDEYAVIGQKVNRKVGKEILAGYEHFYKVSETMCKAMSRELFLQTAKEVLAEHNDYFDENENDAFFTLAEEIKERAPLDAMILYAVALDVGNIKWSIEHPNWNKREPYEIYENLVRALNTRIYMEHPEVFIPVRYGMKEAFPQSIWGYDIEVNGKFVRQY
jgi:hypothetical protein